MTLKISKELRDALAHSAGKPVEVLDDQTSEVYVLMTQQDFRRLIYDDSDLTPEEMIAAATEGIEDRER